MGILIVKFYINLMSLVFIWQSIDTFSDAIRFTDPFISYESYYFTIITEFRLKNWTKHKAQLFLQV